MRTQVPVSYWQLALPLVLPLFLVLAVANAQGPGPVATNWTRASR